jgi:ABC-type Na+ transport system ATPase subunit NatA
MLDDNGIKSYFFKRLIPILNKKINEYLELFELPVKISFNEFMEEKISMQLSSDLDISYMSFSEGEKKRIDIAILLSFIETTKILSNWNCNVIMFDEVLDNATDSEGLDKLLSSIKDLTTRDSKLCSYIISHRDADSDLYDRKVTIKKVAGFSKLQETK